MRNDEKRPDDVYAEMLDAFRWMERHADRLVRAGSRLKRWTYRAVKRYLWLMENAHEWLLKMAASEWPDASSPLDAWLRAHFAPVELLGQQIDDVVAAVAGGMTERQFIADVANVWVLRQKSKRAAARKAAAAKAAKTMPAPPPEDIPIEVQLAAWKGRAETEHLLAREQAGELRVLRRRLALLEREIRRLRLIVKRVDELEPATV